MANFQPLKNYVLFCLDELLSNYGLKPPFLDAGCGTGYLSRHLALKGWHGKAIDYSSIAIRRAKHNLKALPQVEVQKSSLFEENGKFGTVISLDVLEHVENDTATLKKMRSLLRSDGHFLASVSSNPREWRWDDEFYGHVRRYTVEELGTKMVQTGLEPIVFWDVTYPVFWLMRRIYTVLKGPPAGMRGNNSDRTKRSSTENPWNVQDLSWIPPSLWLFLYKIQFAHFRNKIGAGHAMLVLAKKI